MPKEDTQFKPGQSGNPGGRPPTAHVRQEILRVFRENPGDVADIVKAQIDEAKKGNTAAFKATVEWVEPALPKEVKVTSDFADKVNEVCELTAEFLTQDQYNEWHPQLMSILRPSLAEAAKLA